MKKLLAIILTLAMVLSVLAIEVAFATTEPTITVETVEAEAGDTVEVKVLISNNPGIWGLKIQIDYDESVLTLTSAENGDFFANSEWTKGVLEKVPYTLSYGANDFADITTVSVTLATLTFSVSDTAEAGTYDIIVDYEAGNIINSDLDDVDFAMVNGKVTIPAPTPEVTPTPHPSLQYLSYEISNGEVTITKCKQSVRGTLEIPSTIEGHPVTKIGNSAFIDCDFLANIIIPDSVTTIESYAFWCCFSLTSINIPASVTSIGEEVFYDSGLEYITVDKNNTVYYSEGNCLIEKSTKKLIVGCENSIIPDGVKSIGAYAFFHYDIRNVIIPDGVTSIGDWAFDSCVNLTSITIPDSVTSVGNGAFYGCSSLEKVYYTGTEAQWNDIIVDNWGNEVLNAIIVFNYGIPTPTPVVTPTPTPVPTATPPMRVKRIFAKRSFFA